MDSRCGAAAAKRAGHRQRCVPQRGLIGIVGALNLGDAVRHLMERSSDAAVLVDEHRVVSYASPVDEVVGTPITDRIHPEDHQAFEACPTADPTLAEPIGELPGSAPTAPGPGSRWR